MDVSRDEATAALYYAQRDDLVRLAYFLTSDWSVAEELVQEAFVRTWRAWPRLRDPGAAPSYVRRTVVHLARSTVRRRLLERRHRPAAETRPVEPPGPGDVDLLRALTSLPSRKRACVVLRYYCDLTEPEVAEVLGVSVGTVKSQTHKALRRLEELLAVRPEPSRKP